MSLNQPELLKIVNRWDEREDDFVEDKENSDDIEIVERVQANPKKKKKITRKPSKCLPSKVSGQSKTNGKNVERKTNVISKNKKKKNPYTWNYGHRKPFSIHLFSWRN